MKVTAIYGQSHQGISWTITQTLISHLKPDEFSEFFLPRDGPGCCIGCRKCFLEGEDKCPHHDKMAPIVEAIKKCDVLIISSPNYVDGMSGASKDMMDHLAYAWMSHRPMPEMFDKTGIVIACSAGAGNRHVLDSMEKQMRSWMIPKVHRIGLITHAWGPEDLSDKKKHRIDKECRRIASDIASKQGRIPFSMRQRLLFSVFRSMQSGKSAWNETDRVWWEKQGWLGKGRPWKKRIE